MLISLVETSASSKPIRRMLIDRERSFVVQIFLENIYVGIYKRNVKIRESTELHSAMFSRVIHSWKQANEMAICYRNLLFNSNYHARVIFGSMYSSQYPGARLPYSQC